ncbi:cobalamin biosynthetic protein CobC [Parvibaculum indicum]|uniref:threonine-phosphate decarboxylase CobD n=1 Tax=Parvibaculum indicum TaxID=562969 RepID=UPI0014220C64|nr:threonine-phosphate decarboxylase CobD [Parvibaculum indicum]NIJ41949.1 cobalamin biosynthetic protein CobC [Parvibaculum indicum]
MTNMLAHGGEMDDLRSAFPDALRPFIDLSTGINPWPYPVEIGDDAWARLPQRRAEALCREAMAAYLGASPRSLLLTPGTQIAISLLPLLVSRSRIAIASPTYGEHAQAWRAHGHDVTVFNIGDLADMEADIIVVTNPNNPDGRPTAPDRLLDLARRQASKNGFLVVDEAFVDVAPELSLAAHGSMEGLVLLRSFGKFFGLAGLRLGGVLAPETLRQRMETAFGPWAVSGPALAVGARAYADTDWVSNMRQRLSAAARQLDTLLAANGVHPVGGTSLFRLVATPGATQLHRHLASCGIHVRRFPYDETWLRFGLPPDDNAMRRLAAALESFA